MTDTSDAMPGTQAPAPPPAAAGARCGNCGTPLLGPHCHACGQPVKGLVRHFTSIVGDFFDSVFDLDSRTPRTLWPLFTRPGYLTQEYFAGRRVRYVSPVRLFFFLAIVTFFFAQLTLNFGADTLNLRGGDSDDAIARATTVAEVETLRDEAVAGIQAARKEVDGRPAIGADPALIAAEAAVRSRAANRIAALRDAKEAGKPPPMPVEGEDDELPAMSFNGDDWHPVDNPIAEPWLPAFANAWLNDKAGRVQKNIARVSDDPNLYKDALLGVVPTTLMVLLPVFALMLKLAYAFKRRLYMEHLIVALHSHAFLCLALLLLFVALALERWVAPQAGFWNSALGWIEAALWVWMPLYLLLMQKRCYGQGWLMTLLKYSVIGTCYIVLLSFGAAFAALAGLVSM